MLEKKIKTDFDVDAQFWRIIGLAWSYIDKKGFVELVGYATVTADKPVATVQIEINDTNYFPAQDVAIVGLEAVVKGTEQWKNLK